MKKDAVIALWKACFDDTPKFLELYFNKVYADENAVVLWENGKLVSALQMLPYSICFYGRVIEGAYISGACTLPEEQGKGWMTQLLEVSFEEMKKRDIPFTFLIPAEPWLFNYYRKQGYIELFDYSLHTICLSELEWNVSPTIFMEKTFSSKEMYDYFDRMLRERLVSVLHTFDDFLVILDDLSLSNGELFTVCGEDGKITGMAFAYPEDGKVLIKEILYDSLEDKNRLLFKIMKGYDLQEVSYRLSATASNKHLYGMGKIIDADLLIWIWLDAHPDTAYSFSELKSMDSIALTQLLFDDARMSLMLE